MDNIRRILFAVKDPEGRKHAAIDKAIDIAKRLNASLELFHAISAPLFLDLQPLTGTTLPELKSEALRLQSQRLEVHAARARDLGVKVICKVRWDYPPHEAIVRRARRSGADLVIAECHEGSRLQPWLVHLTDWELLRLSPAPVLLFKNTRLYRRPALLAAVDPAHLHAKPTQLDTEIITAGEQMAESLGGSLHVMHANHRNRKGSADFKALAEKSGISRAHRHEVSGDPAHGIPKVARATRAQIVVMGAMSRSGLKRVFIGNTAERVLPDLPCDVLVVKPPRFKSRVTYQSRGMRVVTPPPLMSMPM